MAAAEAAQAAPPDTEYDETQCVAALAQLERLQNQLDDLRLTLPRIVEPFHMPSKPPMFHAFKDNLIKAQRDMKHFRAQWQSQETQTLFEHAKRSAVANPDLVPGAQIQQYGWVEIEEKEKDAAKKKGGNEERAGNTGANITKAERERMLGDWKMAHPSIKVEERDDGKEILITFAADSTNYHFRVVVSDDPNAMQVIKVDCEGTREPFTAISRCLASRPNANDLKFLLDMIAAYKVVGGLRCAKCSRMLDDDTAKPVARRSRRVVGANETNEIIWESFHEGCLNQNDPGKEMDTQMPIR